MSTKTFFLGLGGQKCGSSWIQAYLNRQDGADFGRLGEYQIWESDLGSVFARYRVPEPSTLEKLRVQAKLKLGGSEPVAHLRWRMQTNRDRYFEYFADLLDQSGIRMTGDITPSYAALPAPLLRKIKTGMQDNGIKTKVIFSMRDPVDRIRSHMRMEMAKGRLPSDSDNETPLRGFFPTSEAAARTRYDLTLEAIDAVFDRVDVHLCFFEELFTPSGVKALARFAQVPVEETAGQAKVNAREKGGTVSDELTAEIARHYAPVYRAVAERFPHVRDIWPSARYVLG